MSHPAAAAALAALQTRIGQEVQVSDWLPIMQERVDAFAEATGDHQWIHVDAERARRESPFGGPIAHGYLTLSLLVMLRDMADPAKQVPVSARSSTTASTKCDSPRRCRSVPGSAHGSCCSRCRS